MYINIPNDYIVPIKEYRFNELYLNNKMNDSNYISTIEFTKIKKYIIIEAEYFYVQALDILSLTKSSTIKEFHMLLFEKILSLIFPDLEYKKNSIEEYKLKFTNIYEWHIKHHDCKEIISTLSYDEISKLIGKARILIESFDSTFEEIKKLTERMSDEQISEIILSYFESIMKIHLEIIPCYTASINNMSKSEIINLRKTHADKITKLIKSYKLISKN